MIDDTEVLIKEKNLSSKDIYWLEMEQDSYRDDKEKFEEIEKTINKLKTFTNSMKEKRYFVEIVIKDSETLEPVRSISTGSDYPESFFSNPHPDLMREIHGCVDMLCSIHFASH